MQILQVMRIIRCNNINFKNNYSSSKNEKDTHELPTDYNMVSIIILQ